MTGNPIFDDLFQRLKDWYDNERPEKGQDPQRYSICAGLTVLEYLRVKYPILQADYVTPGNQVRTSRAKIQSILKRYGEARILANEGGRTTRSTRPSAERLAKSLNESPFHQRIRAMNPAQRADLADPLQEWLVDRVREFFDRKPIAVKITLSKPGWEIVADILAAAAEEHKAGAVSQHLVGAKLAARYPGAAIENHSHTTADKQLGRPGDFTLRDTVFHVTMAPMPGLFEKCRDNVREGYRVRVLVPQNRVLVAIQMAESAGLENHLGIVPLEQFIGQNVEEMGDFSEEGLKHTILDLLRIYNDRVIEVESDKSLLIKLPENLENDDRHG